MEYKCVEVSEKVDVEMQQDKLSEESEFVWAHATRQRPMRNQTRHLTRFYAFHSSSLLLVDTISPPRSRNLLRAAPSLFLTGRNGSLTGTQGQWVEIYHLNADEPQ